MLTCHLRSVFYTLYVLLFLIMTSPYLFEPEYEHDEADNSDNFFENNTRGLNVNFENRNGTCNWCQCEKCVAMPTDHESICCQEYENLKNLIGNYKCTTKNN